MESTTFHLWFKPEIIPRFLQPVYSLPDGSLIPGILPYPHPPADEYGGNGLRSSVPDFMRILHDIISPTPILLKAETVSLLFAPQFSPGSGSLAHLYLNQTLFENSAGGHIGDLAINYGLGALLMMEDVERTGAKKGTLAWGGLTNLMWWANSGNMALLGFMLHRLFPILIQEILSWRRCSRRVSGRWLESDGRNM